MPSLPPEVLKHFGRAAEAGCSTSMGPRMSLAIGSDTHLQVVVAMADEEVLLDSDLEAVEPAQPKGRNWLKLLSVALVVAAVGVIGVAALPKASAPPAPLSPDAVELYGVSVTDDALVKYDDIRIKRAFSYVIYEIKGGKIETTAVGDRNRLKEPSDTVIKDLVDKLPANAPRYAVLELNKKLIFVRWSPQTAGMRDRMMYSASSTYLRTNLKGVERDVAADNKSELSQKLQKVATERFH